MPRSLPPHRKYSTRCTAFCGQTGGSAAGHVGRHEDGASRWRDEALRRGAQGKTPLCAPRQACAHLDVPLHDALAQVGVAADVDACRGVWRSRADSPDIQAARRNALNK